MSTVLSYNSVDQTGKNYKETLGEITLDLNDESTRAANAQKIDTFTRAVCALTTNTYQDAEVVTTLSINEILSD